MNDNQAPEPAEIELAGDGPFILSFCGNDIELAIGEAMALLTIQTLDGKEVQIPFGLPALKMLHELTGEALRALAGAKGETLQ